jgi:hypothetical protein
MYWFAFERSAFHLFSINCVDAIFKIGEMLERDDEMLVAILGSDQKVRKFRYDIRLESEQEIVMECRTVFKGFQFWKDSIVPLGCKGNPKFEGDSQMQQHSLKILLGKHLM